MTFTENDIICRLEEIKEQLQQEKKQIEKRFNLLEDMISDLRFKIKYPKNSLENKEGGVSLK